MTDIPFRTVAVLPTHAPPTEPVTLDAIRKIVREELSANAALEAAARQALEALQGIYIAPEHGHYINEWWPACRDAIPALRAALKEKA